MNQQIQTTNERLGDCDKCQDYGRLQKTEWEDPQTDSTGIGWLCGECISKVQRSSMNLGTVRTQGSKIDLKKAFNPVPKPKKKK